MREEWGQVALGELFERTTEFLTGDNVDAKVFSLLKAGKFVPASQVFGRRIASKDTSRYKLLRQGMWAYSTIHIDEGSIARFMSESPGIVSPMYTTLGWRGDGIALPRFIELAIRTPPMLDTFRASAAGSVNRRRSLRFSRFAKVPIDLPPLSEQRRIVDLIGAVDAQIEAADHAVERAERARRGLLSELLAPAMREGWRRVRLGDVVSFAGGYAFPERFQRGLAGDIPFFRVSDMNASANSVRMRGAAHHVTAADLGQMRARAWPAGTVIFPKVGAALLTEKRRVLDVDAAFDNNILGLVPTEEIDSAYLLEVMRTVKLSTRAQPGAVPSINQSHVADIPLLLPSRAEQRQVVEILGAFDSEIGALKAVADQARELRKGLLTELLSGDHEIPASYDRLLAA